MVLMTYKTLSRGTHVCLPLKSPIDTEFVKEPLMSAAPCLADTNDLAQDPTAEDCQPLGVINNFCHCWLGPYFFFLLGRLSFYPSLHASYNLPFLSLTPPSPHPYLVPLRYSRRIPSSPPPRSPQTLSSPLISPSSLKYSFPLSIIHSAHLGLPFAPFHSPSPPLPPLLSLSLHCPWVGKRVGGRPQCGPSREGKGVPQNTHNSVPLLGLRDKGKPHTWLTMWVRLVEEEASNWHQSPPQRVCGYMSVCA